MKKKNIKYNVYFIGALLFNTMKLINAAQLKFILTEESLNKSNEDTLQTMRTSCSKIKICDQEDENLKEKRLSRKRKNSDLMGIARKKQCRRLKENEFTEEIYEFGKIEKDKTKEILVWRNIECLEASDGKLPILKERIKEEYKNKKHILRINSCLYTYKDIYTIEKTKEYKYNKNGLKLFKYVYEGDNLIQWTKFFYFNNGYFKKKTYDIENRLIKIKKFNENWQKINEREYYVNNKIKCWKTFYIANGKRNHSRFHNEPSCQTFKKRDCLTKDVKSNNTFIQKGEPVDEKKINPNGEFESCESYYINGEVNKKIKGENEIVMYNKTKGCKNEIVMYKKKYYENGNSKSIKKNDENGNPMIIEKYYSNKKIKYQALYYTNRCLKTEIHYHTNGQKREEKKFTVDNWLEFKIEYSEDEVPLCIIEYYSNGQKKKKSKYYSNGKIQFKKTYSKTGSAYYVFFQ